MSPGLANALGALVLYGLADFVYKRAAAAGAQPHRFLMVQTWFFTPLAIGYGIATGTLLPSRGALWGLLAGVLAVVGYYNFAWSLRHGAVSTNATIFRLSFVVTALLGIVILGEPLSAPKVAGLALALTAVWLLVGRRASAGDPRERAASLARVLVATLAVGVLSFSYKLGLRMGATPVTLVASQGVVAVTVSTLFTAYAEREIRPSAVALRHAPISAALLVAAFILLAKGLELGEASVIAPVAQMGFVVTAVLGFLILREPVTGRRTAGLAAAVLALASFAWS
ncbi:MAG TPA: DMT family transporter [Burkholderiales bacterium]|nr:DMT family transporter [Burkholderiales bacterium]